MDIMRSQGNMTWIDMPHHHVTHFKTFKTFKTFLKKKS